jgi:hypothetical protein
MFLPSARRHHEHTFVLARWSGVLAALLQLSLSGVATLV